MLNVGRSWKARADVSAEETQMHQYDAYLHKIIDRTHTARYGLWSAMITAHSVFLSVAVALASLSAGTVKWQVQFIAHAAILCILFISGCFISSKAQYEDIGKRLAHYEEERSEVDLIQDIGRTSTRFKIVKWFEILAVIGLNVEALLLLSVILA